MSENVMLRPVIGVGVLVWRDRQLLLGKRVMQQQENCWQFPGGHLEANESVIACASREVMQETGVNVRAMRHLGFTDKPFTVNGRSYISLLVSCDFASGEVSVRESDKCECWQWFDYQQLPSPLFEPIEIFLSQHTELYQLHINTLCVS